MGLGTLLALLLSAGPAATELEYVDSDLPELNPPAALPQWSIVWALLPPRFELTHRLSDSPLWVGGRIHAINIGVNEGAFQGVFFGVAALAHWRIEDEASWYLGLDVYGGLQLDYADVERTQGSRNGIAPATVVGIAGRLTWFQLAAELHVVPLGNDVLAFVFPALEVRHTF